MGGSVGHGVIPADDKWIRGVRQITTASSLPLIIDEVQTGLGRTGRMFAFEHAGITPDVLVLSKAIGGGLPLSVVVYDKGLDTWKPGAHAGTFRGNQLAMAAGSATLRYIHEQELAARAETLGQHAVRRLTQLQRHYRQIGDVRGRGLMIGVEFIAPDSIDAQGYPAVDTTLAQAVQHECLRRGLILETGGRYSGVLRFLPPLVITEAELDRVADIFEAALQTAITTHLHKT